MLPASGQLCPPDGAKTVKFRGDSAIATTEDDYGVTFHVRETTGTTKAGTLREVRRLEPITIHFSRLSQEMLLKCLQLGAARKPAADAALSQVNGKPAPAAAKWKELRESVDLLLGGLWEKASVGSTLSPDTRLLIEAAVQAWGQPTETVEKLVRAMTTDERNALHADPDLKPIIDRLRAEKAKAAAGVGVDVASLKAKLKGLQGGASQ
jgi:hypothetical protein